MWTEHGHSVARRRHMADIERISVQCAFKLVLEPSRFRGCMMSRKTAVIVVVATALFWSSWHVSGQQPGGQAPRQGQSRPAEAAPANLSSVTKDQFDRWMKELS